jgi:hypothetical protein
MQAMETWTEDHPDRPLVGHGVPRYKDVARDGVGRYLRDPLKALPGRLYYE